MYRGLYHVLLGRIAPLEGIGPDQLTIDALVRAGPRRDVRGGDHGHQSRRSKGDGTALYISNLLASLPLRDHPAGPWNHHAAAC